MATVTRFDEAFDDLLRGFFVRPVSFEGSHGQAAAAQFRVEVSETEQEYVIRAEIPGVKKDDINISIDADQVAISAEAKNEKEAKDWMAVADKKFSPQLNKLFVESFYEVGWLGRPTGEGRASGDGSSESALVEVFSSSSISSSVRLPVAASVRSARESCFVPLSFVSLIDVTSRRKYQPPQ